MLPSVSGSSVVAFPMIQASAASIPVQVTTVDGLVSTFTVSNVFESALDDSRSSAAYQGWPISERRFHVGEGSSNIPMILDFSATGIATLSNGRRSRRGGTARAVGNRSHARAGQPHDTHTNSSPVQGPIAPPQRQGAPVDYKYFGRCDQTCQHCYARFWWEERRTGLPASVAPQYQRCCAGGRAYTLREHIVEGLIQFLDENNALVRLFRTARDKLREADIPNFNIRLFGVIGANQYDLPTADSIGAIVYEGGPETMTDYDVVIERHYREPESVNKLHPQYMALQFPLLFIYGEEGRRLSNNEECGIDAYISAELPNHVEDPEGFRVVSELMMHGPCGRAFPAAPCTVGHDSCKKQFPKEYCQRTYTDNKGYVHYRRRETGSGVYRRGGSAIKANADLKEKDRFDHDLQLNSVYRIQGFGFEKTDGWGKTLDNDFTLCFGKHTQTDLLKDDTFPHHYFNFAAYNELGSRLEKKNPILTDYIGYIHNVEKVKEYGSATGNKIKLRNIAIRNLNNSVVLFTLWNEEADGFKEEEYKKNAATSNTGCQLMLFKNIWWSDTVVRNFSYFLLLQSSC
ncbi:hypothetical protein CTI12_AA615880 [Artemisia annua]|uniref:Helitron helicase-like domain-containing protein n=1 Tax=Artemisia annua TaxID=35608 RepID=A0A2U1KDN3_ARTAN|nr:hypothetical protein CTI12_AA615880 [Artemisia annua]